MAKAKAKTQATDVDFEDLEVDPTDLEEVEVDGDVDSWIAEMLAGPSEDSWAY